MSLIFDILESSTLQLAIGLCSSLINFTILFFSNSEEKIWNSKLFAVLFKHELCREVIQFTNWKLWSEIFLICWVHVTELLCLSFLEYFCIGIIIVLSNKITITINNCFFLRIVWTWMKEWFALAEVTTWTKFILMRNAPWMWCRLGSWKQASNL